ncbi:MULTISPECIES: HAD family hydrolase [unclassified Corynebacterium]|uniref:HAD family hydrolase n=1 Tax=unclassified Corynebacterium TaxID=2624378 RepID=UPI002101B6F6|nr:MULTISPECIES: HAD family hydrolase [unclassified Corynebacterium]MDK6806828.1 HAD family hydrolase [Corynebacterium aurimucosum]
MTYLLPQLVALDMDGTLLDAHGQLPADFSVLQDLATARGCELVPASGRQLATLKDMFPKGETFIAENGSVIMRGGEIIAAFPLAESTVHAAREAAAAIGVEHTVVLCSPETAYVARDVSDAARTEIAKYYKAVTWVDDLDAVPDSNIIKIAIFCESGSEAHIYDPIVRAVPEDNVAVSGKVWLDVMARGVEKGTALTKLAELAGIPIAATVAFGDYLNDFEMLRAAGTAVAMENAHPQLKEIADIIAPANTDNGVSTVLRQLLRT